MLITGFIYTFTCVTLVTANYHGRTITLNDGNKIPSIGFGTFGKLGPAVVTAVEAGYRLIDAAYIYLNEEGVGDAISKVTSSGIVKRKQLFVISKTTEEDYPYLDIWKGMEDAKMLGLTKSIGVANFNSSNINIL